LLPMALCGGDPNDRRSKDFAVEVMAACR